MRPAARAQSAPVAWTARERRTRAAGEARRVGGRRAVLAGAAAEEDWPAGLRGTAARAARREGPARVPRLRGATLTQLLDGDYDAEKVYQTLV